ncbi:MAG: glycosyltransferase family 39 protein [Leptolyngbya sp. UWPOB_LEPTO1]|uniref:glycosyltransferase family 39 protein n=1 Tax=Leptolyngbya sp. UWPOB_LEPTO1 TaxID=2815653 RepID=UPI001AD4CEF3|nr:glycosyltransferase family 39 protein [Leptolyngbya sp. UWPOB_LEPTO1]MBN8560855.1 glycosyltransferase family 39 protein [Leptolyngbya sp. UWPOB_LEPTO1]
MNIKSIQPFRLLVVILLLLGIFFRFASLGERPYWHDEAHTLLRSSGYTLTEITTQIFNAQILDRDQVLKFQQLSSEKTEFDVVRSLATEEPHRAPLFYTLLHYWMRWFGNDLTSLRILPSLLSLLVFPAIYWLCLELFGLPSTGWIAIALVSVSPFQVYYAQEVREYSLWAATTLFTSAAYLHAMRSPKKLAWSLYSVSIILSLYTSLLSLLIWVGHCIHAIASQKVKLTKPMSAFLKASFLGFLGYLPWLFFVAVNLSQVERSNAWMFQPTPLHTLLESWVTNYQFIFLKRSLAGSWSFLFTTAIGLLTFLSARSLILRTRKATWVLIALLVLPLLITFVVPDLIWGGLRSTNGRYFVPCYLGIQLAVAHLFATQLKNGSNLLQKAFWRFALVSILTAGVLSCTVQMFQNRLSEDLAIASMINQAENAIVVSAEESYQGGGTIGDILTLSHLVQPSTKFQLAIRHQVPSLPNQPNLYLYKPLTYLKQNLQQTYTLQPIYKDKLFQLLPK